jgi:hypothetical protein
MARNAVAGEAWRRRPAIRAPGPRAPPATADASAPTSHGPAMTIPRMTPANPTPSAASFPVLGQPVAHLNGHGKLDPCDRERDQAARRRPAGDLAAADTERRHGDSPHRAQRRRCGEHRGRDQDEADLPQRRRQVGRERRIPGDRDVGSPSSKHEGEREPREPSDDGSGRGLGRRGECDLPRGRPHEPHRREPPLAHRGADAGAGGDEDRDRDQERERGEQVDEAAVERVPGRGLGRRPRGAPVGDPRRAREPVRRHADHRDQLVRVVENPSPERAVDASREPQPVDAAPAGLEQPTECGRHEDLAGGGRPHRSERRRRPGTGRRDLDDLQPSSADLARARLEGGPQERRTTVGRRRSDRPLTLRHARVGTVAGRADRERAQQEHGARRHAGDDQEQPDGRPPPAADHQREAEPDHAATGDVTIRPSRTVTSRFA